MVDKTVSSSTSSGTGLKDFTAEQNLDKTDDDQGEAAREAAQGIDAFNNEREKLLTDLKQMGDDVDKNLALLVADAVQKEKKLEELSSKVCEVEASYELKKTVFVAYDIDGALCREILDIKADIESIRKESKKKLQEHIVKFSCISKFSKQIEDLLNHLEGSSRNTTGDEGETAILSSLAEGEVEGVGFVRKLWNYRISLGNNIQVVIVSEPRFLCRFKYYSGTYNNDAFKVSCANCGSISTVENFVRMHLMSKRCCGRIIPGVISWEELKEMSSPNFKLEGSRLQFKEESAASPEFPQGKGLKRKAEEN